MKLSGTIKEIYATQNVSATFQKREFVVEYAENPEYPQYIKMEFIKDKCSILDQYQVGQSVEVEFNLNGRPWQSPQGETKYFVSLQAWKLNAQQAGQAPQQNQQNNQRQPPSNNFQEDD